MLQFYLVLDPSDCKTPADIDVLVVNEEDAYTWSSVHSLIGKDRVPPRRWEMWETRKIKDKQPLVELLGSEPTRGTTTIHFDEEILFFGTLPTLEDLLSKLRFFDYLDLFNNKPEALANTVRALNNGRNL